MYIHFGNWPGVPKPPAAFPNPAPGAERQRSARAAAVRPRSAWAAAGTRGFWRGRGRGQRALRTGWHCQRPECRVVRLGSGKKLTFYN